jgi:archaellum component FlaG (FlaF/FlaG flagellin family)
MRKSILVTGIIIVGVALLTWGCFDPEVNPRPVPCLSCPEPPDPKPPKPPAIPACSGSDLVIDHVRFNYVSGQIVNYTAFVRNIGKAPANLYNTSIGFAVSINAIGYPASSRDGRVYLNRSLNPGEMVEITTECTNIWPEAGDPTQARLLLSVASNMLPADNCNVSNDATGWLQLPPPLPPTCSGSDLIVDNVTINSINGQIVNYTVRVKNVGTAAAISPYSVVRFEARQFTGAPLPDGGEQPALGTLEVGESKEFTVSCNLSNTNTPQIIIQLIVSNPALPAENCNTTNDFSNWIIL